MNVARSPHSEDTEVELAFVGDICLPRQINHDVRPLHKVHQVLAGADVAVGNLECCLGTKAASAPNVLIVPASGLSPETLKPLTVIGLANNHAMDGGGAGLALTREFLAHNGFSTFGAGEALDAAERLLVVTARGIRIGFIGACEVGKGHASAGEAGVAPMSEMHLLERIAAAKASCDVIVVVLHADLEFSHHPSPRRVRLCRRLIDAGAHAVVQHHPHVCQGIEEYRGGVIAYSLGNFVFPVRDMPYLLRHAGTEWGMILLLRVRRSGREFKLSYRIEPVDIDASGFPTPSLGDVRERHLATLARISREVREWQIVRRQWWRLCMSEARSTAYFLAHRRRSFGTAAMLKAMGELISDANERRWMVGAVSGGWLG